MNTTERQSTVRGGWRCALNVGCALLLLSVLPGCLSPDVRYDLGFLATRDAAPEGPERFQGLGPFVEWQAGEMFGPTHSTFFAVRPFYSAVFDAEHQKQRREFLWPVGMDKTHRGEYYSRYLSVFYHDFDVDRPGSRCRFLGLPLVYAGRDQRGESYFALFPVGGVMHEFLGRDTIGFALWPLYCYSRVNDVRTHDVLWPVFSRTRGPGVSRFRVLPLYARSVHEDEWRKHFVLWPLWSQATYTDPDHEGKAFMLVPLYGRARITHTRRAPDGSVHTTDSATDWVLPPLFKWARSGDHRELNCPYPVVQYASGTVEKLYLWPLWGKRTVDDTHAYAFLLWPIITRHEVRRPSETITQFSLFPLIYHEAKEKKVSGPAAGGIHVRLAPPAAGFQVSGEQKEESAGTSMSGPVPETRNLTPDTRMHEVHARYFKLWPLFSYRREADGVRFRTLALWPTKDMGAVERNFAPFWTLYTAVRVEDRHEQELLWGLYRHRRDGDAYRRVSVFPLFSWERGAKDSGHREWRCLLGLVGGRREGLHKQFRLLYFFTFGSQAPSPVSAPAGRVVPAD